MSRREQIETYYHHGALVKVRSDLKGRHRDFCLCHSCGKLDITDRQANCPKANMLYALCCLCGMTTPVFECPDFVEKPEGGET